MRLPRFVRFAATFFLTLTLAVPVATPAFAQMQHAARPHGAPPSASPTSNTPEGTPLAAPTGSVETTEVGQLTTVANDAREFNPLALFLRADWVVKTVLVLLVAASFWSWVVIIDKLVVFRGLKKRALKFENNFWSGRTLDDLYSHYSSRADHPIAAVFVAAVREWKRSFEKGAPRDIAHVNERVEKAMNVAIARETERLERGLGFLATTGSTAPFVGLFGTVWGIMHSFEALSTRQDANTIAAVAPGISEALFATALGLLAAIPAVIFYNRLVNELGRYTSKLDTFADELSAFLSRQLDEGSRG